MELDGKASVSDPKEVLWHEFPRIVFSERLRVEPPNIPSGDEIDKLWPGYILEWFEFQQIVMEYVPKPLGKEPVPVTLDKMRANDNLMRGTEELTIRAFQKDVVDVVNQVAVDSGATKIRIERLSPAGNELKTNMPTFGGYVDYGGQNQSLRVIGLVKADFTELIIEEADFDHHEITRMARLARRRWLGELAEYLIGEKLRFGFITTHLWTIFVELRVNSNGVGILEVSLPVKHDWSAEHTVTARLGLWFLMSQDLDEGEQFLTGVYDEAATKAATYRLRHETREEARVAEKRKARADRKAFRAMGLDPPETAYAPCHKQGSCVWPS